MNPRPGPGTPGAARVKPAGVQPAWVQHASSGGALGPDERGSALLWAALVAALMLALAAVLLAVGALTARGHATQGAADLAALAGARAQLAGRDACAEARRTAGLNQAEVTGCWVAGDEVELVVTVDTAVAAGAGPWRVTLRGHANAGVLTGAPEQVG